MYSNYGLHRVCHVVCSWVCLIHVGGINMDPVSVIVETGQIAVPSVPQIRHQVAY